MAVSLEKKYSTALPIGILCAPHAQGVRRDYAWINDCECCL